MAEAAAELALSQAWLERRLAGLTPEDFEGDLCVFCTADLHPPPAFEDVWVLVGLDWDPNSSEPILPEDEAAMLRTILVVCNQTKRREVDRLCSIITSIDAWGIDAPPLYWVPHTAAPEYHREGCLDYVPNEIASDLLQRGLDGIVPGEPEGMGLVIAVRSKIRKSASLSQNLQEMVADFRTRSERARHLEECMQKTLWEYVRVRMAPEIPPINHDIPHGEIQVPGYAIGSKLGQGSFGSVYQLFEAPDAGNEMQVVKVVSKEGIPSIDDVKYLSRMIYVMKRLSDPQWFHPNLVALYETTHSPSHILFRSEYGGPENLYRRLNHRQAKQSDRCRPLALDRVVTIMSQIVDVTAHLHTVAQVCHRDIKLENIIVNDTPDSIAIKLADFDVAVVVEGASSICHSLCGTFPFVAPEVVLDGEYDCCAADVWSLGVVLLEILCGLRVVERATEHAASEQSAREERAQAIRDLFQPPDAAGAVLQESCRSELRQLQSACAPVLNGMLDVDPCQRIEADEVRAVLTRGLREAMAPPSPSKPTAPKPSRGKSRPRSRPAAN